MGLLGAGLVGVGLVGAGLAGVDEGALGFAGSAFPRAESAGASESPGAASVSRVGGSGTTSAPTTSPVTPVTFRTPRISTVYRAPGRQGEAGLSTS